MGNYERAQFTISERDGIAGAREGSYQTLLAQRRVRPDRGAAASTGGERLHSACMANGGLGAAAHHHLQGANISRGEGRAATVARES